MNNCSDYFAAISQHPALGLINESQSRFNKVLEMQCDIAVLIKRFNLTVRKKTERGDVHYVECPHHVNGGKTVPDMCVCQSINHKVFNIWRLLNSIEEARILERDKDKQTLSSEELCQKSMLCDRMFHNTTL